MNDLDEDDTYGITARLLHGVMALLIFGLIVVGLYMGNMETSPEKWQVYGLHKSFGLMVLWLAALRIVWRGAAGVPDKITTHKPWEVTLSKLTHLFLYVAMVGMPLSGWLMSSSGGHAVSFFGIAVPALMGKNDMIFDAMKETHEILAFLLIGGIGLHAAGAFKHHIIDRDVTLTRMWPMAKSKIGLGLLILLAAAFFAAVGFIELTEEEEEDAPAVVTTSAAEDAPIKELLPNEWAIMPSQSKLAIQASMSGTPFEGEFKNFDGVIFFDPENMSASRATIVINTGSLVTGSAERDTKIGTEEWFDTEKFPTATFESVEFAKGDGNNYIAIGNLTIRGVTLPVTLPFQVDVTANAEGKKMAKMTGTASINRLDYGVGQGQWAATDAIADAIKIAVSVTAVGG